jgi:hypothetical protein
MYFQGFAHSVFLGPHLKSAVRWAFVMTAAPLCLLSVSGCIESETSQCAFGLVCPAGMTCVDDYESCFSTEQVEKCRFQDEMTECELDGVSGRFYCQHEVCLPEPFCGDGRIYHYPNPEQCDGSDLDDTTCKDLGFDGGWLFCDAACRFDETECALCGDDICESTESVAECPMECGAIDVAAGGEHTCAVTGAGSVKCWGDNYFGQVGVSGALEYREPVRVAGLNDITDVAAGNNHTCALDLAGKVFCYGSNSWGQLGDGTTYESATPVAVVDLPVVTAVSCRGNLSCALEASGSVYCWGADVSDFDDHTTRPEQVSGLTNAIQIDAGWDHVCALASDGTVWCWGQNDSGQLGDGSDAQKSAQPVRVVDLTNVVSVDAGDNHTCAIGGDGTVWCWGNNEDGQLGGGGATGQSNIPVAVSGASAVVAVAGGSFYSCAVRAGGDVFCWGNYSHAHDDTILDGIITAQAVTAGSFHGCFLLESTALGNRGVLKCRGANLSGQLGDGTAEYREVPTSPLFF